MSEQKRMTGKGVLVSGSGTGIGRGIALEFAREGADVAFHYAHSEKGALAAVEEARGLGVRAQAFQADFSEVHQVRRLAGEAIDFLGRIDVLVNNSSITMNMPFEDVTVEQFDLLYHVNIRGMFFLAQACLPSLKEAGGAAVVNISSIHGVRAWREHSVYAGTKGAIIAFTRELAIELAPEGIRVNGIAPGAVEVESFYKVLPGFDRETWGRGIPAGFLGQPRDVARVVVFLASEEARYILGQTLVVDGGTTCGMSFNEDFRKPVTASGICFGKGYVPGI